MERYETPDLRVTLYENGTSIRDIANEKVKDEDQDEPKREDVDDPFYLYDLGDVVTKDKLWAKLLPNVEVFFAVKSNPDPVIIRLLIGLGKSFDCASKKEIKMVLDLGASADRIIFAHPYKQESHLRFAKEKGVRLMTFDTAEELQKVKRVHPKAQLVLRIRYDDSTATFNYGSKFGCRGEEVRPLLEIAKKLGLDVVGISFHIGSESSNPQIFSDAIRFTRPLFDIGTSLGFNMKLLDLGGGFPGRLYPKATFDKFADVITRALDEHFPASSGVRIIAEPGTFHTRSAGYLVANVIAKRVNKVDINERRERVSDGDEPFIWIYYLNVGVFNGFNGKLFDPEYFDLPEPLHEPLRNRDLKPSTIFGPTCDSNDVIMANCMFPEMDTGEFVLFHDMGGYTVTCACDFNGFSSPPTWYIAPKEIR
ncbi:ornithine decarboxylase-like [Patiria miniata]|uniref:ornithine decarboxylase n=2 Tax=Patiria miniata TaxID=46514 RepID=A0A913Z8V7_PATMI|nr:ornithine decarboxylase-like [Patiria miniata]